MPRVSYLICCHNETETLNNLLQFVIKYRDPEDEIIILDDFSDNPITNNIINEVNINKYIQVYYHHLDNNYGGHKNFGIEKCNGDYIFQLDGDELPPESLIGKNLHNFLNENSSIEAFAVPRINDFRGVTEAHAKQWGWRLSISEIYNRPIVNWCDHQWRIFKRDYPRISFTRRLHEKIEGYLKFAKLPPHEMFAIYHDKTIETQIATNLRYNQLFTQEENKGHSVFK